jgi:hypothetical protein
MRSVQSADRFRSNSVTARTLPDKCGQYKYLNQGLPTRRVMAPSWGGWTPDLVYRAEECGHMMDCIT